MTIKAGATVSFTSYGQAKTGIVDRLSRDGRIVFLKGGRWLHLASVALVLAGASATVAKAETPAEQFKAVCESRAHRSDKLETACKAGQAPDAVKAGDRFKAVGIGAEVNTLWANIEFIKA